MGGLSEGGRKGNDFVVSCGLVFDMKMSEVVKGLRECRGERKVLLGKLCCGFLNKNIC